jgi:hypothetical protein
LFKYLQDVAIEQVASYEFPGKPVPVTNSGAADAIPGGEFSKAAALR